MVNWLLENGYGENTDEAVEIGNYLMTQDVFHHVCRDHPLKNKKLFYIFEEDERDRGHIPDPENKTWQNVLEERNGELLSADEVNEVLASLSD